MNTIIKIKTWGCVCGYHQDFEPIIENCPSCIINNLYRETDEDKLCTVTIKSLDEIDDEILKRTDIKTKKEKESYKSDMVKEIKESIKRMKLLEN